MVIQPAYRLRVYQPLSADPTETTVLTPAAGAPHTDELKLSSIPGVAGYKEYLHEVPRGRRGRLDPKKPRLDVGTFEFSLIDKATGSGNASRWLTAFFGNVKGKPRGRLKVEVDESLDGGATWASFMIGELTGISTNKNDATLEVSDRVEKMKMPAFVGSPHSSITYAAKLTLLPAGFFGANYGSLQAVPAIVGTINANPSYLAADIRVFQVTPNSKDDGRNLETKELGAVVGVGGWESVEPTFQSPARCHLKRLDTSAEGDFYVGGLRHTVAGTHWNITSFFLKPLAVTDAGYMAMPPNGTSVEAYIYVEQPAADESPLLIGDVDPATFIQDLCDGKFSSLYRSPDTLPAGKAYGDVKRTIPTNGIGALVGTRPVSRHYIKQTEPVIDVIERICFDNNWAPFLDKSGRLNIKDLDLPTSLAGLATITDDDVEATSDSSWKHDATSAVARAEITFYQDLIRQSAELKQSAEIIPSIGDLIVEEITHKVIVLYTESLDYGDEVLEIDARSYRAVEGEQLQGQDRTTYLEKRLRALAQKYRRPWEFGAMRFPLTCRRTATITGLKQGDLVLVTVSWIPDPYTHLRGGQRLCRVLELSEEGPTIHLELLDVAINTISSVPMLAAPAQEAGNTYSGVTSVVTLNAEGQPVEIQTAVTETSVGAAPAADSLLWSGSTVITANGTATIRNHPAGKRVWVRGRSFSNAANELQVPSAWVMAAAPGYVDLAALPAPSALSSPAKTHTTVDLTWTNGAADVAIDVLAATPVGDTRIVVGYLIPGTTQYTVRGLLPATTYRFEVRHQFLYNPGAGVTVDVTTDAAPAASCPAIAGFQMLA